MTNTETPVPSPARVAAAIAGALPVSDPYPAMRLPADDWEMIKTALSFTADSLNPGSPVSVSVMRIFHAISAVTGYTD